MPLPWRHNDHGGVSNHQPHGCLLNRLFRRRSKKTSKLRVTGLRAGNSPGPVNSPHKGPVTRKMVPFDDVIMPCWWSGHTRSSHGIDLFLWGILMSAPKFLRFKFFSYWLSILMCELSTFCVPVHVAGPLGVRVSLTTILWNFDSKALLKHVFERCFYAKRITIIGAHPLFSFRFSTLEVPWDISRSRQPCWMTSSGPQVCHGITGMQWNVVHVERPTLYHHHCTCWWPSTIRYHGICRHSDDQVWVQGPVPLTTFCPQFKFDGNFALL